MCAVNLMFCVGNQKFIKVLKKVIIWKITACLVIANTQGFKMYIFLQICFGQTSLSSSFI